MAMREGQAYILRLTAAQRAELERLSRELDRWPRFAERFGLRPPQPADGAPNQQPPQPA